MRIIDGLSGPHIFRPHIYRVSKKSRSRGVSLIELIVFIVVVSIAFTALIAVYMQSASHNVDPIIRVRLLEAAQSRLDQIIALKYDESTPTGGIPACGSAAATALPCTNSPDANMNDVDDFNNKTDEPYPGYSRNVTVTTEEANNRKLVSVSVSAPTGEVMTLSTYRYNF